MKKLTIVTLLTSLTIFTNCRTTQEPSRITSTVTESTRATPVTIFFSGLMVFHKEENKPSYEVGILDTSSHRFSIVVDSVPIHNLPKGRSWILEVTNPQPTNITPLEVGHEGKRRPDNKNGRYDFSWIIDLEGPEFHNRELDLKPGLLKPIIHLPNGLFYTRYKSIDLKRAQGIGSYSDFGFVPETIGLQLELREGQELVLKDADPNGQEAFRLKFVDSPPPFSGYVVNISNVRHTHTNDSDFKLYYGLFNGIDKKEYFDFTRNEENQERPLNPLPGQPSNPPIDYYLTTCCAMTCTKVLLGRRIKALE